jgi:hypothetical protein
LDCAGIHRPYKAATRNMYEDSRRDSLLLRRGCKTWLQKPSK